MIVARQSLPMKHDAPSKRVSFRFPWSLMIAFQQHVDALHDIAVVVTKKKNLEGYDALFIAQHVDSEVLCDPPGSRGRTDRGESGASLVNEKLVT